MVEMPRYENPISLIPGGCPQLLDYEGSLEDVGKIRYGFSEIPEKGADGRQRVRLHAYRRNEDKEYVDEMDPAIRNDSFHYEISGQKATDPARAQWPFDR